jgi:hypothetical protein
MCYDDKGQLFSFSAIEVKEGNSLGLEKGQVYLILGPREKSAPKRKREEVRKAYERFERVITKLGARPRSSRGKS